MCIRDRHGHRRGRHAAHQAGRPQQVALPCAFHGAAGGAVRAADGRDAPVQRVARPAVSRQGGHTRIALAGVLQGAAKVSKSGQQRGALQVQHRVLGLRLCQAGRAGAASRPGVADACLLYTS